jgi:hypothetical protein
LKSASGSLSSVFASIAFSPQTLNGGNALLSRLGQPKMKVVLDFRQVPQMSFSYNPFDHESSSQSMKASGVMVL